MEFFAYNGKFVPEGKAYADLIYDAEYENTAEFKLFATQTIYFDGTDFTQFSVGNTADDRLYYSGEYDVGNDDKLDLTYNYYCKKRGDEELYIDLKNKQGNIENNRASQSIVNKLNDANHYDYVLHTSALMNINDKNPYMLSPYYQSVQEEGGNWNKRFNSTQDLNSELYATGSFLVAKQK